MTFKIEISKFPTLIWRHFRPANWLQWIHVKHLIDHMWQCWSPWRARCSRSFLSDCPTFWIQLWYLRQSETELWQTDKESEKHTQSQRAPSIICMWGNFFSPHNTHVPKACCSCASRDVRVIRAGSRPTDSFPAKCSAAVFNKALSCGWACSIHSTTSGLICKKSTSDSFLSVWLTAGFITHTKLSNKRISPRKNTWPGFCTKQRLLRERERWEIETDFSFLINVLGWPLFILKEVYF